LARHWLSSSRPFPVEFLEWQVRLRAWTAQARGGVPHAGVAPIVVVRNAKVPAGVSAHSVICGLLPRADALEAKTAEFRSLYESGIAEGARAVYDRALAYLRGYYEKAEDFDPTSITTLLPSDSPLVDALRAERRCSLVFHVLEFDREVPGGAVRCLQQTASAEVLEKGAIYDNVFWHNALFHGPMENHVVVRFGHEATHDTRFGRCDEIRG
jgi:hypothetical protein